MFWAYFILWYFSIFRCLCLAQLGRILGSLGGSRCGNVGRLGDINYSVILKSKCQLAACGL